MWAFMYDKDNTTHKVTGTFFDHSIDFFLFTPPSWFGTSVDDACGSFYTGGTSDNWQYFSNTGPSLEDCFLLLLLFFNLV